MPNWIVRGVHAGKARKARVWAEDELRARLIGQSRGWHGVRVRKERFNLFHAAILFVVLFIICGGGCPVVAVFASPN